jgi:hypothetical protein
LPLLTCVVVRYGIADDHLRGGFPTTGTRCPQVMTSGPGGA